MIAAQWGPAAVLIAPDLHIVTVFGREAPTYIDWPEMRDAPPRHILDRIKEPLVAPLRKVLDAARKNGQAQVTEGFLPTDGAEDRIVLHAQPLGREAPDYYLVSFLAPAAPSGGGPESATPFPPRTNPGARSGPAGETTATPPGPGSALTETRLSLDAAQTRIADMTRALEHLSEQAQCREEELRTTLEELETTNEELESTNEELSTLNDELVARNRSLNRLNDDLNNLEQSVEIPLIVLNHDLTLRRHTAAAERVLQVSAADIGRPLSAIAGIRRTLPTLDIAPLAASAMDDANAFEQEIQAGDGRWHLLQAKPYRQDDSIDGAIVTLTDIDTVKRAHKQIEQARNYAQAILRTARVPLVILRSDLRIETANEAFYETFRLTETSSGGI